MASYTTRVELVNPDASDFDLLHQEMRDKQFYRALSYCGTWHDMPDAEYDRTTNLAMVDVYNDGIAAAQAVINNKPISDKQQKKDFYILVTKADGPRTLILPKTTELAKLPPGASL
jgi:homoaconitase/3-isopropylmalate dehydratase large subunit